MKKYVITGSIGHISKPLVTGLVKAGKEVTVITSSKDKVKEIESLGAKASVGSVSDAAFVKTAFKGADVVYTMIPPIWQTNDWRAAQDEVASNYVEAIKASNIKYVVNLSSIGAHRSKGIGPVNALYSFEQQLNSISRLNVKHLRAGYFYYNLLNLIPLVKGAGILGANYGDKKFPLVHTSDIAAVALDALIKLDFKGNSVTYVTSDVRTGNEVADVIGKAINKQLPWVLFTDDQQLKGMLDGGVPATHAGPYVEMGAAIQTGIMQEEAIKESINGSVRLEDYAKEFALAYSN